MPSHTEFAIRPLTTNPSSGEAECTVSTQSPDVCGHTVEEGSGCWERFSTTRRAHHKQGSRGHEPAARTGHEVRACVVNELALAWALTRAIGASSRTHSLRLVVSFAHFVSVALSANRLRRGADFVVTVPVLGAGVVDGAFSIPGRLREAGTRFPGPVRNVTV